MEETAARSSARSTRRPDRPLAALSGLASVRPVPSQVLMAAIAAGCVPALLLWWRDTAPGSLRGGGDCLLAAGRIAGLLAAYLLLVLIALMARVPWLETRVGSDVAARYHRGLGEYTVALACAHALLVVGGYAWQSGTDPVGEGVTVLCDVTDVWMSAIALGLLVLVGVVSARAVRRRLPYEAWYHIHLVVYLAAGLAFAHEFAVGADFSASLRNRVLWSGAHIAVAAAVLLFRVALPLRRSRRHRVRVASVVREGPDAVSLYLTGRDLHALGARPGQFLRWRFLAPGQWWQSHPYSLSAPVRADGLRLTVKGLGDGSASLARLSPGTRVLFEGPYGAFTAPRPPRTGGRTRPVLLVAAGAGITPIRALYESLPGRGADVVLLYRASTPAGLLLYPELEEIAARRGFGLHPLVGPRGTADDDPLCGPELARLVPDAAEREVFVCGPAGLADAVCARLREAGVPRHRIHVEAFTS